MRHSSTARSVEQIDKALVEAGACLRKTTAKIRKPWLSEHTFDLIQEKYTLEQNRSCLLKEKIKEIRRSKRNDWEKYTDELYSNDMDIRDKWMGIKQIRNKSQTEFV